jgi:hypothetical protein
MTAVPAIGAEPIARLLQHPDRERPRLSEQTLPPLFRQGHRGAPSAGEINAFLADPKMKARRAELGGTVLPGSTADFGKLIAEETAMSAAWVFRTRTPSTATQGEVRRQSELRDTPEGLGAPMPPAGAPER